MISFITGKPRQGKSFYSVKLVLDELKRPDGRPIVTNLVFRRSAILDYLVKYCRIEPHEAMRRIETRLVDLPAERARDFFRVRGINVYFDPEKDRRDPQLTFKIPDFESIPDKGVMYVIDEVHNIYGARNWKASGELVLWYNSQHGKLLDDCFFITQAPKLVESQFRLLAFEWHHIRNGYQQKVGVFSARKGFFRKSFYVEPTTPNATPYEEERFEYHQAIADCYDTNAGIGIVGRGDPSLRQSKGVPFWVLPSLALLVVVGFWFAFNFGTKAIVQAVASSPTAPAPVQSAADSLRASAVAAGAPVATPRDGDARPWPVLILGDEVVFNNGRRDHVARHAVFRLQRASFAMVDGVRVPYIPLPPSVPAISGLAPVVR